MHGESDFPALPRIRCLIRCRLEGLPSGHGLEIIGFFSDVPCLDALGRGRAASRFAISGRWNRPKTGVPDRIGIIIHPRSSLAFSGIARGLRVRRAFGLPYSMERS
jgi:hypothetical protein